MLETSAASPTELRRRAYRGEEALAFLADPRWTELVERQARPNPTLLGGWQRALALQRRGEPLVIAVTAGNALVAGGAFAIQCALGGHISYATWLGSSFQSFSPDALATSPDAADALVDELLAEVDLVKLMAVGDGVLVQALRRRAPWGSIARGPNGTYFSRLPSPTRNRLLRDAARDERRAARAGVEVELRVATEPSEVAPALERLFRLHRERWAGHVDENANFARDRTTRAVHRAAVAALAEQGRVRLVEVREDGLPVAAILGLVAGRGGLGYVMAMRARATLKSPGYRSFVALAEQLLADGCTVVDIGGGPMCNASPKARLEPVAQPFSEILTASSPWLQQVFHAAFLGRSGARAVPLRSLAAAATHVAAFRLPHAGDVRGHLLHGHG